MLEHDKRAHELMAELEEIYHGQARVDFSVIETKYAALSRCVSQIVHDLERMVPSRYLELKDYYKKFDFYVRFMLSAQKYDVSPPFTLPLTGMTPKKPSRVGGKAHHLAILGGGLHLPIPAGFVVTTSAFHRFIQFNDLRPAIDRLLSEVDILNTAKLNRISGELMQLIRDAGIPPEIEKEIHDRFRAIVRKGDPPPRVAVRSSAVGEDSRSSFAGQYRTVLNVDEEGITSAYRSVIASKYAPEALYYRINYGLTDAETPMAVLILEMVDAAASGVMYTADLETHASGQMEIHSTWGLGELLVQGEVSPDIYTVKKGEKPLIVARKAGVKPRRMVFARHGNTRVEAVREEKQTQLSLDGPSVLSLAKWGLAVEAHFGEPQDIEWCLNRAGDLLLLQARPLNHQARQAPPMECVIPDVENRVLLTGGDRASSGVGTGRVFHIRREADLNRIPDRSVLVSRHAASSYVKILDKLSAVVTDMGSITGHFASVAREFGVPVIVNTGRATKLLENGREVTVYADQTTVFEGAAGPLLESPCIRRNLMEDSPFMRKLEYVIGFVSPLRLLDPANRNFTPGGCRSLHDIIRFAHEKCVQEMFTIGNRKTGRKMGAKKLTSHIPMMIYLLDVGEGLEKTAADQKEIHAADIRSRPFLAVWKGLNHPGIQWSQFSHFNWEEYDRIVMSGGIISADSAMLASYAVISGEYLNLNLKFGYHFVILDAICGERREENHILFRFAGGGGDAHGRSLRADFLSGILERLDFWVQKKSDLVDARFESASGAVIDEKLDMLGRLLGATRLMDMYLKEPEQVAGFVNDFLKGRYHFASVEMEK